MSDYHNPPGYNCPHRQTIESMATTRDMALEARVAQEHIVHLIKDLKEDVDELRCLLREHTKETDSRCREIADEQQRAKTAQIIMASGVGGGIATAANHLDWLSLLLHK